MINERSGKMNKLADSSCVPCRGNEPPLTDNEIASLAPQVSEWTVIEKDGEKRLERVFKRKDFAEALAFTQKVGLLAESQDHHPLIITEWGRVTVQWWTHKIKGLHRNDFIMAAKTDLLVD
jgi:4a-hydroxytetrahydrobiopterin dehydratase